jgi:signal transduction histidine kinase
MVTVGTLPDGFYIEDDGPEVLGDGHEQVFEAGYSTAEGNIGFGLRIVKQLATAHGWAVEVTDGNDSGARFVFTGVEFDKGDN